MLMTTSSQSWRKLVFLWAHRALPLLQIRAMRKAGKRFSDDGEVLTRHRYFNPITHHRHTGMPAEFPLNSAP
jgi:hypothetical protein